ncbi:MAG: ribbon-helix-helix protein, CopG family [Gammaproteobacteria bacterium]|nr:ribbon-helix-helix protein, CopG family [Gammaproteobacteria bacterium]
MSTYTIHLPREIDERLSDIARHRNISKAEVMQRAFALLAVAVEEEKQGHSLGILKSSDKGEPEVLKQVVGI